jgi:hypothetical protein
MSEDFAPPPWIPLAFAPADVPPSLLEADVDHVALSDRCDPLDAGFVLAGGVLAPLPGKVRLPHEDDEGLDEDDSDVRG